MLVEVVIIALLVTLPFSLFQLLRGRLIGDDSIMGVAMKTHILAGLILGIIVFIGSGI